MGQVGATSKVDVLIIGGGPAGATASILLARKGYSVALFEKEQHPRFHIGESLLPMNLPIFQRLGISSEVAAMGIKKYAADFSLVGAGNDYRRAPFSKAITDVPEHAYQVKRDEFDQLLFRRAAEEGADCFENCTVERVSGNDSGGATVSVRNASGDHVLWEASLAIDASGRDALIASKNGWKKKNRKHASAAVFAHFTNVQKRPGIDQGNISIYAFEHGWVWMIPLPDDVFSIGLTCTPEFMKTRQGSLQEFLMSSLKSISQVDARMGDAVLVSPVHAASNYSYESEKVWDDHFIAIGDAAIFVDPIFSSGVYLAMKNAEDVVPVVEQKLLGNLAAYRASCRRYCAKNNKALKAFKWFIYRFNTRAMRYLFQNPRNVFGVQSAVISMLSGDVFDAAKVMRRLWLFRCIYLVASICLWRVGEKAELPASTASSEDSHQDVKVN